AGVLSGRVSPAALPGEPPRARASARRAAGLAPRAPRAPGAARRRGVRTRCVATLLQRPQTSWRRKKSTTGGFSLFSTSGDRRCEKITTSGVWVKPPPKKQKSERQVRSAREAVRCRRPATKGAARCIRRRACWKNESGDGPSEEEGDGRETASAAQASDVEDVLAGAAHGGRLCVVILAEEPPYDIARVPAV
ncbi:unnamed protein product, partial [Prorocentrum cordatum]